MSNHQYLHDDNPQQPEHPSHAQHEASAPTNPPIEWPNQQEAKNPAADLARQHVERAHQQSQTAQPNPTNTHQPMRSEQYDWDSYHTAWQQYYHQYFYRYYANWLQQQQPGQQPEPTPDPDNTESLRHKIRQDVAKSAKKVTGSSHFKPLIAATFVAAVFLFVNYNQVLVGAIKQYVAPGSDVTTPVIVEPGSASAVGPEPKVVIPKIGVDAPVVYDEPRVDEASYQKALERGAVRLGTTANPGTKGNVVIGAHSSNNVFNAGQFKYVFVNLRRLEMNDIVYLHFNGQRYTYRVTVKKVITPKDVSVLKQTSEPMVTLFTCDPPGANVNRLVIQATQIDPNPANAGANTNDETKVNEANPLPSVAPSLWDRLFRRS